MYGMCVCVCVYMWGAEGERGEDSSHPQRAKCTPRDVCGKWKTHRQKAHAREPGKVLELEGEVKQHVEGRGQEGAVELDGHALNFERAGGLQLRVGQLGRAPQPDQGGQEDGPDAEDVDELWGIGGRVLRFEGCGPCHGDDSLPPSSPFTSQSIPHRIISPRLSSHLVHEVVVVGPVESELSNRG